MPAVGTLMSKNNKSKSSCLISDRIIETNSPASQIIEVWKIQPNLGFLAIV
jgi:hypothetical protein